jgi:thioredoxin-dependent peroxiredoxin
MKLFKKMPVTVLGNVLKVGEQALDFEVLDQQLEVKKLSDYQTPYMLLNVIPSLDTSVCSLQTRTLNEQLASMKDLTVLTLSNDLPFAQKRWCGAEGLPEIVTLSDYRDLDFAMKYGVLIQEFRLLARSVFVLDQNRKVIYVEYVDNMSNEPNYEALLNFLSQRR